MNHMPGTDGYDLPYPPRAWAQGVKRAAHGICVLLLATVSAGFDTVSADASAPPSYHLAKTVPLGPPDSWDYLHFDSATRRVYVAHGTEITVVDGDSGKLIGRLKGIGGAHGVDLTPPPSTGFAVNGERGTVSLFDPEKLRVLKQVRTDQDSDALVYDPASGRVFVMNGEARDATTIDAANGKRVGSIALGGEPEFTVADGDGKLYANIENKREVVRIDTRAAKIDARWPIADCDRPHGLAIDRISHRLFVSCINSLLMVVDSTDGKIVAKLPIGKGTDGAAFDPKRKLVFSSNGEGTLSIIVERTPDQFEPLVNLPTAPGAKTIALDPASGRIYLVTADVARAGAPREPGRPPQFQYIPGSVKLLMFDPDR